MGPVQKGFVSMSVSLGFQSCLRRDIHGANAEIQCQTVVLQSWKFGNTRAELEKLFRVANVYVQLRNANIAINRDICRSDAITVADPSHLISINKSR